MMMYRQKDQHHCKRQRGAVAIIVAICIAVLVGMLGLVLDLGHLFVAKTELQNAADAAALSGARELDGTMAGLLQAEIRAIETAARNRYDLNGLEVELTADDLWVGSCPGDECMTPISLVTADIVNDKTFLKVDTSSRNFSTWFIHVLSSSITNTSTFAVAVAGKYLANITPIGMCQLWDDPDNSRDNELGYERGLSYKLSDVNPITSGDPIWIIPSAMPPDACNPATASATASLPYVCTGKITFTPIIGDSVYTNTGISDPQLSALDSRFGDYSSQGKCVNSTAPADTNIREYRYTDAAPGSPADWIEPDPTRQSVAFLLGLDPVTGQKRPLKADERVFSDLGVIWSSGRPSGAVAGDWGTLYGGTATAYPEPSPYKQPAGSTFHQSPNSSLRSVPNRRNINVLILDCAGMAGGGVCEPSRIMGIGSFLLQKRANQPTDKEIYLEFNGLLPSTFSSSDIRLYR